jgi:hypothetical protein
MESVRARRASVWQTLATRAWEDSNLRPADRQEVIGGSVPELVAVGAFARARLIRSPYPEAAKAYADSTNKMALEWAEGQIPNISSAASTPRRHAGRVR